MEIDGHLSNDHPMDYLVEYTFRTTVSIETSAPELAWLNDGVNIAVGAPRPGGDSYDGYLVE